MKDDRYAIRHKREMYQAMVPIVTAVLIQSGRFEGPGAVAQAMKIMKWTDEAINADESLKLPAEDV